MTSLLIAGYGSIGARHARLAADMGVAVACVTRNAACTFPRYTTLERACAEFRPTHLLIANSTADHLPTLERVIAAGWSGPMLIEKPLFHAVPAPGQFDDLDIVVAYNLRFHPLVRQLHELLGGETPFSASFRVGQYLPDWRPGTDYRTSYSASHAAGGGVLRDLSHEIDLAYSFCGPMRRLVALGGKFSNLEIDADDVYFILGETDACRAVNIEMNYLDRIPSRSLFLNCAGGTAVIDFMQGALTYGTTRLTAKPERDATYIAQLKAFFEGDRAHACLLRDALHVDATALAAERSVLTRQWIAP